MVVAIDDIQTRLDSLETLLAAQLPSRHIKRSLVPYVDQDDTELTAGILTIVNTGEADYTNKLGMIAKEGTSSIMLVAHLRVAEGTAQQAIETAELAFIAELKAAIRVGVPGIGFALERVQTSRQLEHPYGWFVALLDAGPPLQNLY